MLASHFFTQPNPDTNIATDQLHTPPLSEVPNAMVPGRYFLSRSLGSTFFALHFLSTRPCLSYIYNNSNSNNHNNIYTVYIYIYTYTVYTYIIINILSYHRSFCQMSQGNIAIHDVSCIGHVIFAFSEICR